jgi:hypothetical protein
MSSAAATSRARWARQAVLQLLLIASIVLPASSQGLPRELSREGGPPAKTPSGPAWVPPANPEILPGDTAFNPIVIASLPFAASGNTCNYLNDYYFPCGDASAQPSPDVVYMITPAVTTCVDVSLCGSDYDTGLYVCQTSIGNPIACNDDYCAQQSKITALTLLAGVTYFIVVDGYAGCGNYTLSVTPTACRTSCAPLACPAGAVAEGEPTCYTGYLDNFNGGCNSAPVVYQNISDPQVICGTYGKYCSDNLFCFTLYRDTDWYRLVVPTAEILHVCVQGEATTQVDVIDASGGCAFNVLPGAYAFLPACDSYCMDVPVGPGTYWIFVAPQQDASLPACGSRYVLSVSHSGVVPANRVSWGHLKSVYR